MMQHKLLTLDATAVKFADEGTSHAFAGYASVFNGIDSYGDMIAPGAYRKTLKNRERPVQMRWNHFGPVIGKWTALREDEKGLYVEGELTPGHSVAEDARALMKHGAVSGLSIGYRVVTSQQKEGHTLLKEIDLFEISVVEEPADNAARISEVKAAIDAAQSWKEIEAFLREEWNVHREAAKMLVHRCKSLALREEAERKASVSAAEAASLIHRLMEKTNV